MTLKSRRKHSNTAGKRTCFTRDDVWEMIAYLDFCLLLNPDHQRFKNTISTHLEEHTRKWFPFEQIDKKIRKLWNDEGIKSLYYYCQSIYHYGSQVLRCVQDDPELKYKIQRRVEEIRIEKASGYVGSGRRRTRSQRTEHHIVLGRDYDFMEDIRTPRKVSVQVTAQVQGENETNEPAHPEIPSSIEGMSDSPASLNTTTTAPTVSSDERSHTPDTCIDSTESEDNDIFASICYVPNVKQENVRFSSIAARSFDRPLFSPILADSVEPLTLLDRHTLQASQSQIAKLQRENAWHREEVDVLKAVITNLTTRLTATTVSKPSDDSIQQCLINSQCEVHRLKSIINDKEIFKPFTKPGSRYLNKQERTEIERNMVLIEKDIENVFIFLENMGSCSGVDVGSKLGDLSQLWQRAAGSSGTLMPPLPFQLICRSLLSAAICMWVFEPDFDDTYLADSHLRHAMLSHLRIYDGKEAARGLDLAAHKTLIASEYFQKTGIPLRADGLAIRLSDALKPLLELQNSSAGLNTNVSARWEKQRDNVKRIFETALKIKVTALVSNDVYEVVLPVCGDAFDRVLMSERDKSAVPGLHFVRLAVAPGLRGFESDRQQVDYNSFRSPGSAAEHRFDLIKQAKVILD